MQNLFSFAQTNLSFMAQTKRTLEPCHVQGPASSERTVHRISDAEEPY